MRQIAVFVALAWAISWLAWLPILLTHGEVLAGQAWPTHLPGLLGPAGAAAIVAWREGEAARADLWRRCSRLPRGVFAWIMTLSPLIMLVAAVLAQYFASGQWPAISALGLYSGLPELGVLPVLAIVFVINGFGEEIGWRGFLLPRLQGRFGPLLGTLLVWPIWLIWHLPLFAFLADFQNMGVMTAVFGWGLGLLAGTVVLANVSHIARGSVIAAAIWHLLFNTAAGTGLSPLASAVATTCVMVWAFIVLVVAWRGRSTILSVSQ